MNETLAAQHVHAFTPSLPVASFFYILGLGTMFGNGLTMTAGLAFSSLRTGANLYIVSLAGTDALVGVQEIVMGFYSLPDTHWWFHSSESACMWVFVLTVASTMCSSFNIALIALDRYFCMANPAFYGKHFTDKRITMYIGVCWFVALVYGAIPFAHNEFDEVGICVRSAVPWVYRSFLTATIYTVCLVITIAAYVKSCMLVTREKRRVSSSSEHAQVCTQMIGNITQETLQTLKMFLVICVVFVVFCTPVHVLKAVESYTPVSEGMMKIALFLLLMNSGMNFFIYPYYNSEFRRAMATLLTCRKH